MSICASNNRNIVTTKSGRQRRETDETKRVNGKKEMNHKCRIKTKRNAKSEM